MLRMDAAAGMRCWICGEPALSGEHLIKRTMLREMFGKVTQRNPLYYRSTRQRRRRLQSVDANYVKLHVLCERCNSSLTQPFDRAWDIFWSYLRRNQSSLQTGCAIRRDRVYRWRAATRMLDLHLYAVKLFGCVAANFAMPLDISGMADAIKQRRPFPNVYLGVGRRTWLPNLPLAGPSDVDSVIDESGRIVFAVWFLVVGAWEFQFIYAVSGEQRDGLADCWNPISGVRTRQIRIKRFD